MERTTSLVWIDLEMTGLDPERDVILEIASIVTDDNLQLIEDGPSLIINHDDEVLNRMNDEVKEMHIKSGLTKKVQQSTVSIQDAELQTYEFIKKHSGAEPSPLCGNSVWQDRIFLTRYMPRIIDLLHYRIIDVSTIKELVNRWYPHDPDVLFNKQETHRALQDIRESIDELKHYRRYFFV